jgi:hypothetical protein
MVESSARFAEPRLFFVGWLTSAGPERRFRPKPGYIRRNPTVELTLQAVE